MFSLDNNKNKILLAGLATVALVIVLVLLKTFIFSTDIEEDLSAAGDQTVLGVNLGTAGASEEISAQMKELDKKIKDLDSDIFNDPKFKALQEKETKEFDINKLDVGKRNPFVK